MDNVRRPQMDEIMEAVRVLKKRKHRRHILAVVLLVVLVPALAVTGALLTVARPFTMDSTAMMPTLCAGQVVLVNAWQYAPARGDIAVSAEASPDGGALIRRVIGLPGDKVTLDAETGAVSVNDMVLDEPYVTMPTLGNCDMPTELTVPAGYVYVLGDERVEARDSRSSQVGLLPMSSLIGRAWYTVYPTVGTIH